MDLILSDLHSNLQALRIVLRYAKTGSIDRYVLLGDLVGYGANPNETLDLVRQLAPRVMVRGNHDRACITPGSDHAFSLPARMAVTWTRNRLSEENAWFLEHVPMGPLAVEGGYTIAHGSPLDEDDSLLHPREALLAFDGFQARACFFGHTHLPGGYELDETGPAAHHPHLRARDLVPARGTVQVPMTPALSASPGTGIHGFPS